MNFVNLDSLRLPDGWCSRAEAKRQKILEVAGDAKQRAVALRRSSNVWAEAKPALSDLSVGKCWYCEIAESRSDLNVDHFRPKSRVAENKDHEGYWWLAVDSENFRLSCQFCNQRRLGVDGEEGGGKWDHFPLLDETGRAMSPADDIRAERVALIDPTQAIDVSLLSFDYDGKAFPNPQKCLPDSSELTRAKTSVELYHLNHRRVVDERKKLNRVLKRDFDLVILILGLETPDTANREALRVSYGNLKRAVVGTSELSSSARSYLRSRRGDSPSAATLVEDLLEY